MAKRAPGEGSIYQRKDGKWVAYCRQPDRSKKFFYGTTQREVRKKLNEALAARRTTGDAVAVPSDRLTVRQYLQKWVVSQQPRLRRRTWLAYESVIRVHAIPALGHHRLTRLEPRHLEQLYTQMMASGLSPRVVVNLHMRLHRALRQAARQGLVLRNVSELVDPPRVGRRDMKTLSEDQAITFMEAAAATPHEALFVLAITSGMRAGELLGLRWCDVDMDAGQLSVVQALDKAGSRPIFGEPKTRSSRRRIYLTNRAIDALRRRRARQLKTRLGAGEDWVDYDLVFTTAQGGPLDITNLGHRNLRRLLRDAGLPIIRFHDLRHTAATLLLTKGVHPRVVADMLGHASVALTLDTYSHVTERLHEQAVTAMNEVFG